MLREAIEQVSVGNEGSEDDVSKRRASEFEDIYRLTYQKTLAFACRRTMTMSDALDVVSETYLVAWRRLDKLLAADEPQAWLYGIASRILLNVNRGHRRRENLLSRAVEAQSEIVERDPAESVAKSEELIVVLAAMAQLSEFDQELLRLAAYEELTPTEIALVLETRPVIVRGALFRARRRLAHATLRVDKRTGSSGHIHSEKRPADDDEELPQ